MGLFSQKKRDRGDAQSVSDAARQTVMIVDDESGNRSVMAAILKPHYDLLEANDGLQALDVIERHPDPESIGCIVSDHRMPRLTGVELFERVQLKLPRTARIIVTGFIDVDAIVDSINKAQIYKFIIKPFDANDFFLTVKRAVETYQLQRDLNAFHDDLANQVRLRTRQLEEGRNQLAETNRVLEQEIVIRQRAESELKRWSNEILALYNNASCGYHSINRDGVFVQMNDTELRWLGRTREEVIGKMKLSDIVAPDSLEAFRQHCPDLERDGWLVDFHDVELDLVRKDGSIVPVLLSAAVADDSDGGGPVSRSTVFDITERKQAQQKQAASERLLRTITDHLPALVGYIDQDRRFQFNNRLYETWLRRPLAQITGKKVQELYGEETFQRYNHHLDRAFAGHHVEFEIDLRRRERTEYFKATYVPQFDDHGDVHGVCVLVHDITDFKAVTEEYRKQKLEADNANASKSRFLAAASHDLRQPLHALGLLTANLKTMSDEASRQRTLVQLEQLLEGMDMEFHALLDVSKFDAGVIKPELSDFLISQLLENIVTEYSVQAAEKGLRFKVLRSTQVVRSDPVLLGQILRNLVSNAIKHTDAGHVTVGCRHGTDGYCRLIVIDSGPGIPLDQQENVFHEFYQLHNPGRNRAKGMGLGLAIVRRIANLLDYPLALHSVVGRGTIFTLSVPTSDKAPISTVTVRAAEIDRDRFHGRFVVVLDDDAAIVENTRTLLSSWGCTVLAVCTHAELDRGLSRTRDRPDLFLLDYRTGDRETGVELGQRLCRQYGSDSPAVLILTGETSPDRLAELRASGFSLLTKPVRPAKLRAVMARIFNESEASGMPAEPNDRYQMQR